MKSKVDRILQELQMHTGLSAGVSKGAFVLDYGQMLRDHIISPLVKQGADGVDQAVANMLEYSLLREDLDGLMEVTRWPDKPDGLTGVDGKIKAAFTRKYNKVEVALPYSIAKIAAKKKSGEVTVPGGDGEIDEDDEDGDMIEKDASIKMKKTSKAAAKSEIGRCERKDKGAVAKGKRKN
jgi:replication factor C subunit 1